jgi:hypothetical protein
MPDSYEDESAETSPNETVEIDSVAVTLILHRPKILETKQTKRASYQTLCTYPFPQCPHSNALSSNYIMFSDHSDHSLSLTPATPLLGC